MRTNRHLDPSTQQPLSPRWYTGKSELSTQPIFSLNSLFEQLSLFANPTPFHPYHRTRAIATGSAEESCPTCRRRERTKTAASHCIIYPKCRQTIEPCPLPLHQQFTLHHHLGRCNLVYSNPPSKPQCQLLKATNSPGTLLLGCLRQVQSTALGCIPSSTAQIITTVTVPSWTTGILPKPTISKASSTTHTPQRHTPNKASTNTNTKRARDTRPTTGTPLLRWYIIHQTPPSTRAFQLSRILRPVSLSILKNMSLSIRLRVGSRLQCTVNQGMMNQARTYQLLMMMAILVYSGFPRTRII